MAPPILLTRPSPTTAAATGSQAPRTVSQPPPDPAVTQGHRRAASPAPELQPRAPSAGGQGAGASGVAVFAPRLRDVKLLFSPQKRAELREANQKRAEHNNPQQLREQAAAQQRSLPGVQKAEEAMASKLGRDGADGRGAEAAPGAPKNMKKYSATAADVNLAATTAAHLFRGDEARVEAAASALVGFDPGAANAAGAADAGPRADALKLLRALAGNPHPSGAQAATRLIGTMSNGKQPDTQSLARFSAVADAVDPKRKARDVNDLVLAVNRAKTQASQLPGAAEALGNAKFNLSSMLTDEQTFVPAAHSPWSAQSSSTTRDAPAVDGMQAGQAQAPRRNNSSTSSPDGAQAAQHAPHPYVALSVAAMAIDLRGPDPGTVFEKSDIDSALKSLRQDGVDPQFQVGARPAQV